MGSFKFTQNKRHSLYQNIAIIILSSAFTFATLVLLVRSGHIEILTTITERVHHEFCSTTSKQCHCPAPLKCPQPEPFRETYPKKFQEIHALRPAHSTIEAARKINWNAVLLPPNGGFLMVEEHDHEIQGYGVSMFHNLHCLTMIRKMLIGLPMSGEHEADAEAWMKDPLHYLHCLDYMAQGIMCSADDTLEKPATTTNFLGEVVDGIDGMGHTHQCRNASKLWEIVVDSEAKPIKEALIGRTSVFL